MSRAHRTDTYPEFPYFTTEERKRVDNFLKEMEQKHGCDYNSFQITPLGSTEYSRYGGGKKLRDAEITAGIRRPRRKES